MPAFDQTEGIPYLVVEVAALFAEAFIKEDVVAGRSREHHAHAHTIGAKLLYQFDGVGRVAQTLGHLTTQFVANDTREIDILERNLAHIFLACHDHTSHPEEDDVWSSHQVAGGVVVVDFIIAGAVDAVEQRDGPEP